MANRWHNETMDKLTSDSHTADLPKSLPSGSGRQEPPYSAGGYVKGDATVGDYEGTVVKNKSSKGDYEGKVESKKGTVGDYEGTVVSKKSSVGDYEGKVQSKFSRGGSKTTADREKG